MKVIIAGSRNVTDYKAVEEAMLEFCCEHPCSEVVSGTCHGADKLGERWAEERRIPIKRMPADWDTHGKKAGYLRNKQMAQYADALVALWDGQSKGTGHMVDLARARGLVVHIFHTNP